MILRLSNLSEESKRKGMRNKSVEKLVYAKDKIMMWKYEMAFQMTDGDKIVGGIFIERGGKGKNQGEGGRADRKKRKKKTQLRMANYKYGVVKLQVERKE